MSKSIFLVYSNSTPEEKISFSEITRDGESFYKIENINTMRPFFMSIVSNSNTRCLSQVMVLLLLEEKTAIRPLPITQMIKSLNQVSNTGCKQSF